MQKVGIMKYALYLFTALSFQFAFGNQAFSGHFSRQGESFFFTPLKSRLFYKISPDTFDVQNNLAKLENGDYIAGNGDLDTANKKLKVGSVDYVGLRKLLGRWGGLEGTFDFKDFTTMRFTPRLKEVKKKDNRIPSYQKEFRYSVSPSDGMEWALFISDNENTIFATLEFASKNKVVLNIYESESGRIVRSLSLEKR